MQISPGKAATAHSVSVPHKLKPCGTTFGINPSITDEKIFKLNIAAFARRTANPWMNDMRGIKTVILFVRVVPPLQGGDKFD